MKQKQTPSAIRVLKLFSHLKYRIIFAISIGVIGIIAFSFMPTFTKNIFDSLEESILAGTDPQLSFIYRQLIIFGLLALFAEVFHMICIAIILRYENDMQEKIINDIKRKLDVLPVSFLENFSPGDLGTRVSTFASSLIRTYLAIVYRITWTSFLYITTAIAMFNINWILSLVVISSLPLCILTARFVSKRTQKYFNNNNQASIDSYSFVEQKTAMNEFYKIHGVEGIQEEFCKKNKRLTKTMIGEEVSVSLNTIYITFIQNFMFLLVTVVFGVLFVNGILPEFGALPAFIIFANRFLANAVVVTMSTNLLQLVNARAPKVFEILDHPDTLTENERFGIDEIGDIEFQNVVIEQNGEKILDDISFRIPRGTSVAFVGPTGNGKSRIIELIAKLDYPTGGRILVDGVDLQEIRSDDYYRRMSIAFEKPFIFRGSVAENLLYGVRRALPENVMGVTKKLGSHSFIELLPERYETQITPNSNMLTASQRQAINVARTLLKANDLVVVVEALSSSDTMTEKDVYEKIMAHDRRQTKIFVTHRLATIENCDIIIFLENGKIAEQGTHEELMKIKGKYYQAAMSH